MTSLERSRVAGVLRGAACIAFVALIVLSPLRARITLQSRPTLPVYGDYTDFLLFWSDIAEIAVLALWGAAIAIEHRRIRFRPRFLSWPAVALLAVAWLGVAFSVDPPLAAYSALRLTASAALALYVVNEIHSLAQIVLPAALMVAVQAVAGIGQVIGQRSLGLGGLGEAVLSPSMPVSVVTAGDGTRVLRAYGLSDHPNILGGVLAIAVLLIAGVAATRTARTSPWRTVAVALGAAALFLTFSRGAWIALVVGLVVLAGMLALDHNRAVLRRLAALCGCGLLVAAPFVLPYQAAVAARTDQSPSNATEHRSVDERVALSEATTRILAAHPLLGTGAGTLPVAMRNAEPAFQYTYQPSSVVLLDVTTETGLIGGAAYLVVLVAPWLALWRRRSRWTPELAVASAALAAVTVVGLFDYYTWSYSAGRIWAWLVLGLWIVTYRRATSDVRDAD
ncbi:MAG TPA: O-antigen ligase family protein [Candidatus Dormibacteraeota bacterium]|nr:O-antigen ligase family protein [Candidatus Dormibacteraeota bacterium]